jgi:hypothetical protein
MAHDVGQGSYIKFGTILGSNPGTHYRVTGINWSGIQRDDPADVSHLLSVAREFIGGETYDPGEVSAEIQFDPSLDFVSAMRSAATNQVVTLVFANGGTSLRAWSAFGQLQSFEAGATRDEMMTGTVTIKLSGEIGTAAVS